MSGKLYLRTAFTPGDKEVSAEGLSAEFAATADEFGMEFAIHDGSPQRVLVMVDGTLAFDGPPARLFADRALLDRARLVPPPLWDLGQRLGLSRPIVQPG